MKNDRQLAEEINFMADSIRRAGIRITCRSHRDQSCAIEIDDKYQHLVLSNEEAKRLLHCARERWGAAGIVSFESALLHAAAPIVSDPALFS